MKPFKLVAIFALVVVFLVGGISVAIAAATAPVDLPELPITLTVDAETVEVSHDQGATWVTATDGEELAEGDMVRTDATGAASINYFDQGVTRLDVSTTVTIDAAAWDPDQPDTFQGRVILQTGRLWARLFDFLSPSSSFEVKTDSTVASVRGTVFSVWTKDGQDGVYVDEHRVHVQSAGDAQDVTSGWLMRVDPKADKGHVMNATKEIDANWIAWIQRNRTRDTDYNHAVLKRWAPRLQEHSWAPLARRMRLLLTSDDKTRTDLRARFMLPSRMLDRLEREPDHADLPGVTAPAPEEPPTAQPEMQIDTTTSLQILIDGKPVTTDTQPTTTPTPEPTTTPTPEPTPVVEPTTDPTPTEPAPYPVSLTVFADDYNVNTGEQTTLHANLLYSDDTWIDVAKDVNWDVFADPQTGNTVGDVVVDTFYAGDTGGSAPITGTYTSGTTRFDDSITITVSAPGYTSLY